MRNSDLLRPLNPPGTHHGNTPTPGDCQPLWHNTCLNCGLGISLIFIDGLARKWLHDASGGYVCASPGIATPHPTLTEDGTR